MAVENVSKTQETVESQENAEAKAKEYTDGLVNSLDLPTGEPEKEKEQEETQEDSQDEDIDESQEDSQDETDEADEEDDTDDEEAIPLSKVKKMLERQEKRINSLTAKLKIQESQPEPEATGDPDQARLNKMSKSELIKLRKDVRVAQIKASDDDAKLNDLVDLETKINQTIADQPKRFASKQLKAYQSKAEEIASQLDNVEKEAPEIKKLAEQIYSQYPNLHKSEDGQAMALELAFDHYQQMSELKVGKTTVSKLKQQNTKLKRKTSLDTKVLKGSAQRDKLSKLRAKAFRGGDLRDKEALVKHDPRFQVDNMIPEEYQDM